MKPSKRRVGYLQIKATRCLRFGRFPLLLLIGFCTLIVLSISPQSSSAQVSVTGVGTWSEQTDYGASSGSSGTGGVPVQAQSCVTDSGYIYCVGGFTGTSTGPGGSIGISSQVFYSQLSQSGTVRAWTETTDYGASSGTSGSGGVAIEWPSCVASNNYIYCVGGFAETTSGPAIISKVYYAPLSSSGVGAWTETTDYGASSGTSGSGGVGVFQTSCVQNAGDVYCIGGDGSKTFYAPLLSSGVGAWTETTDYGATSGTSGSGGVHVSADSCVADSSLSEISCVGGVGSSFNFLSSVFSAPISLSGIGAWTETTDYGASSGTSGSGGVPIYGTECVDVSVSNGIVVGIGGSVISDVYISQVQPVSSSYSPTIICVGGQTTGHVNLASVYYSPLLSSGVGAWTQTEDYGDAIKPVYFGSLVTPSSTPCVYTATKGTGDWNTPSSWIDGQVPPNPIPKGCTVIIPIGARVQIYPPTNVINNGDIEVNGELDIVGADLNNNGGEIDITGTGQLQDVIGGILNNFGGGTIDISPKGVLNIGALSDFTNGVGSTIIDDGDFYHKGEYMNNGILKMGGGTLTNGGTITNNGTLATIDANGTITNLANGTLINEQIIDNVGTFSNAGNITNQAGAIINNTGTFDKYCGATILNHGTITGNHVVIACAPTKTSIAPNPSSAALSSAIMFHARVTDTSKVPTAPNGTISWSDGGAGGVFSATTCNLTSSSSSSSTCSVAYTTATSGPVTITGTYSGDLIHKASSGTSVLTVTLRNTATTVTPNPSSVVHLGHIGFHAMIADTSAGTKSAPTGTVSWSDGGAGGHFSSSSCTLVTSSPSTSNCSVAYSAPTSAGTVTISATYSGDPTHKASSGKSTLTVS